MGAEVLIPLAISALGAGAGAYNTYQTAKRDDQIAAQGIRKQAGLQQEADARVNQEIGSLEGSTPEAERAAAMEQYLQTLRATRGQAGGGTLVPGGSSRYKEDSAASEAGIQNFGQQVAGTLARISAPGRQRQNEAISQGRAGSDLGLIRRRSTGEEFLTANRRQGNTRNPWLDAAGQVAQAAGAAYATRAPDPYAGLSEGTRRRLTAPTGPNAFG